MKWKFSPKPRYTEQEQTYRPGFVADAKKKMNAVSADKNFILWIGHNSFMIRAGCMIWLTDPMFSDRAIIPKRKTPPTLHAKDIADSAFPVNILVTHNHPDHCDSASIRDLPGTARVFVPNGLGGFARDRNKTKVDEMEWWEELDAGNGCKF